MSRLSLCCFLSAGALCACSFDFGGLSNGAGGANVTTAAGLTTSNISSGAMVTTGVTSPTTNVSANATSSSAGGDGGSGTSGATTSASTTNASSSTGLASNDPLASCAGFTDAFTMFPNTNWMIHGMASNGGSTAGFTVQAQDDHAVAFHLTASVDECALTIDLGAVPSSGKVFLGIQDQGNDDAMVYDDSGSHMLSAPNGQNVNLPGKPDQLGIAISGGKVYYLYRSSNTWTKVGTPDQRPTWMDAPVFVNFGINTSSTGNKASFDNFNLTPIRPSDLLP